MRGARNELTHRWLDRIAARVRLEPQRVFPTDELLDHIPLLIDGIADYLEDPADEIAADVPVIAKAIELGQLRRSQGFGAHEILKEYELLGGVLFSFLVFTVDSVEEQCTRSELLACGQRLFRAIAEIQQVTTGQYLRIADEEIRAREERLRGFNRMVSHELKNRIGSVLGAARMLREDWVQGNPAERDRFLSILDRNADGMNATLHDLMSLTETSEDERKERHVRLAATVAEAERKLRHMAQERGVDVKVSDALPDVEVDAAALELCLTNYISNGIKYSDPGKSHRWVEVRAYIAARRDAPNELIVEVRDNGIGVPAESRPRLFERFYRADADSDVTGTGLGLSIVRETMESIGGRAWVDFGAGDGTTVFKLAMPARRQDDRPAERDLERASG